MTAVLTILHVDDDADMRHVTALCLSVETDLRVISAASGREALDLLDAGLRPTVIVLDVSMPDMDGPATLAALRKRDGLEAVPVVFMTARFAEHECQRYRSLGAVGVIPKPFDPACLAADLRALA
jgi:Response regulators consisting of a CheY-like receiver domain and a winged-helix DNA-binding domain